MGLVGYLFPCISRESALLRRADFCRFLHSRLGVMDKIHFLVSDYQATVTYQQKEKYVRKDKQT